MPFKSRAQKEYLRINEPEIYERWMREYGDGYVVDAESNQSFTPPAAAVTAAKKGLAQRKKWGRGGLSPAEAKSQGIDSGVTRARKISSGKVSRHDVRRMSAFNRHRKNNNPSKKMPDGGPTAGTIAWNLWGGSAGVNWAKKKSAAMNAETFEAEDWSGWVNLSKVCRCGRQVEPYDFEMKQRSDGSKVVDAKYRCDCGGGKCRGRIRVGSHGNSRPCTRTAEYRGYCNVCATCERCDISLKQDYEEMGYDLGHKHGFCHQCYDDTARYGAEDSETFEEAQLRRYGNYDTTTFPEVFLPQWPNCSSCGNKVPKDEYNNPMISGDGTNRGSCCIEMVAETFEAPVSCKICGKTFDSFRGLNGHMNAHLPSHRKRAETFESERVCYACPNCKTLMRPQESVTFGEHCFCVNCGDRFITKPASYFASETFGDADPDGQLAQALRAAKEKSRRYAPQPLRITKLPHADQKSLKDFQSESLGRKDLTLLGIGALIGVVSGVLGEVLAEFVLDKYRRNPQLEMPDSEENA